MGSKDGVEKSVLHRLGRFRFEIYIHSASRRLEYIPMVPVLKVTLLNRLKLLQELDGRVREECRSGRPRVIYTSNMTSFHSRLDKGGPLLDSLSVMW